MTSCLVYAGTVVQAQLTEPLNILWQFATVSAKLTKSLLQKLSAGVDSTPPGQRALATDSRKSLSESSFAVAPVRDFSTYIAVRI